MPVTKSYAYGAGLASNGETRVKWSKCKDGSGGALNITGNADWGSLNLELAEDAYLPNEIGDVIDMRRVGNHKITFRKNVYGTGSGNSQLFISYSEEPFDLEDKPGDGPPWQLYTGSVTPRHRFLRVRVKGGQGV